MASFAPLRQRASFLAGPATRRCFSTSGSLMASYGFVGLGRMGYPMATNLKAKIGKEDTLIVHDVNSESTKKFVEENPGTEVAQNVREVAEKSEVIFTALPEPSHVQNVYANMLRPPTLLETGVAKPRLFLDCSTIDPKTSSEVANAIHSSGQGKFVDTPMSGGTVAARESRLTFMFGASDELAPRVTELLSMMGKKIIHLGPQSSGLKGKLANNYILAINNIAVAEAMNMGIKWGLDPKSLADLINTSTGKCWPSEVNNPVPGIIEGAPSSHDYVGGFGTALMNKDLGLAMACATDAGIEPRLGAPCREIYKMVEANEKTTGKDLSVVYQWLSGAAK